MATVAELFLHSFDEVDGWSALGMRHRLRSDFQTEDKMALITLLLFTAIVNGPMTPVVLTVERFRLRREKRSCDSG